MRRRTAAELPTPDNSPDALDTAWRIHVALTDWTGKVDAKASFCFALESAVIVVVVNLTADGRIFDVLPTKTQKTLFGVGLGLMAAALLCAATVVIPRLRRAKSRKEWPENFIYFGHLRHWQPAALEAHIKSANMLPVLTTQLVNMSKIAWRKHVMVQASLVLGLLGAGSLTWCAALLR